MKTRKITLEEHEIPEKWYNIVADMPNNPLSIPYHSGRWRWESINIEVDKKMGLRGEHVFGGSICNMHRDTFKILAMLSKDSPGRLIVSARVFLHSLSHQPFICSSKSQ